MAKADGVFIYIGTYPDEMSARDDYEIVKDLHAAGAVGTYDASVVTKDDNGKVHVNKDETSTRHGAWGGAAVGAVVGILFPPSTHRAARSSAPVSAVSAATCGRACLAPMSRSSASSSTPARLRSSIVGESTIQAALDKADLKAEQHVAKELDVSSKDIDQAVQEAAKEVS